MTDILYWKKKLPSSWETLPIKAIASYRVSSVDKVMKENEISVFLCNYTDVYKNDLITNDLEFMQSSATEEEISKYKLEIGDVLITKDSESWNDIAIPALVTETKDQLLCGYHLAIIRANKNKLIPSFLFRCLQSKEIRLQMELASTGVTRFGLPKDEIGRATIPVPDLEKQKIIVSFIDKETLEIDRLIIAKTHLLHLLSEKRQALITYAVTKGVNPDVKMKASGIDWLGEVPKNWDIRKLKYVVSVNDEVLSENTEDDLEINYVEISDVDFTNGIKNYTTLNFKEAPSRARRVVRRGDVIVSTVRTYLRAISQIKSDEPQFVVSTGFAVIRPLKINSDFLGYFTLSNSFIDRTIANSVGVSYPAINSTTLSDFEIPIPPLNEQKQIASYIENETKKIDLIKQKTVESISLLNEKRAALITAAITGQVKIDE